MVRIPAALRLIGTCKTHLRHIGVIINGRNQEVASMSDRSSRIPAAAVIGLQLGNEGKGQISLVV
jgi:hypothetical protein